MMLVILSRYREATEPELCALTDAGTPFRHCRQRYKRSLRRIQAFRFVSTRGVWQKPKYPRHPMRYGVRSAIICCKLNPRVRHVISRIRVFELVEGFRRNASLAPVTVAPDF